ncbi:MAG: hypothetical protein ABSE82_07090 [Nitrososphaerales archaeon]
MTQEDWEWIPVEILGFQKEKIRGKWAPWIDITGLGGSSSGYSASDGSSVVFKYADEYRRLKHLDYDKRYYVRRNH